MIFPAVDLLNRKGYETIGSCSGHYGELQYPETYIMFTEKDFPFLPGGFVMETLNLLDFSAPTEADKKKGLLHHIEPVTVYRLTNEHKETDPYNLYAEILKANLDLLQWAIALPDKNK